MKKPEILGLEVLTPDGRGRILSLHNNAVEVVLNTIGFNQRMKGRQCGCVMHYSYRYEEVEIIKGRYCFDNSRLRFQYPDYYEE